MELIVALAGSLTTEKVAAIEFGAWGNEGAISESRQWYMGNDFKMRPILFTVEISQERLRS